MDLNDYLLKGLNYRQAILVQDLYAGKNSGGSHFSGEMKSLKQLGAVIK